MSEAPADPGPLTVDAAVQSLLSPPAAQEETAPEVAEAPQEATEPEGEASSPEETDAEPVEPAEGAEAEAEQEAVAPAEPPKYWSKDAKEAFGKLPPDLQAVVLAQEGPREEAAAKAKADAAARIAEAQAEMGKVQQLAEQLATFLPEAIDTFRNRWGEDPDWVAYAQEHGAEAMTIAKAQHDAELGKLQRLAAAKQDADTQAHQAFLKTEFTRLAELAPELAPDAADPSKGLEQRQGVVKYLVEAGIPRDAIPSISAVEMTIAHKAKLWDEAQAKLKAAPPPTPKPAPRPAPVRPAAAQTGSPQQRAAVTAQNAFNLKPSVENAIELLLKKKA